MSSTGNGKTFIAVLGGVLTVTGLLIGWGIAYGMVLKDVNLGVEASRVSQKNCNRLTVLETRLECLPEINRKLDALIMYAAQKGEKIN